MKQLTRPSFLTVLLLSLVLLSCKGDDIFGDIQPNTERMTAEFTDAKEGSSVTEDFTNGYLEVDLTELRLSPRSKADHDMRVKLIVNPTVVSEYNTANGTSYQSPGAANFSLLQDEYVLNSGQRKVTVKGKINPSGYITGSYAVGLSIAEVKDGEISTVANDVIVFISIKNEFDGIYSLKGYSEIPGTPYIGNFTLPCSEELWVVTSGSNSVYLDPTQPVYSNGAFAYISNVLPDFVIDKTTYKVTAVNARAGSLAFIFPYDGYNSRYDPATKKLYVKFGVAPAGSGRFIIDTLTYCGPR